VGGRGGVASRVGHVNRPSFSRQAGADEPPAATLNRGLAGRSAMLKEAADALAVLPGPGRFVAGDRDGRRSHRLLLPAEGK
jgi:hypothetical protein